MSKTAPDGLNSQQIAFCEHIAKGIPATRAYRMAYDDPKGASSTISSKASALLAMPHVAARITELSTEAKKAAASRVAYTLTAAIQEADEAIEFAKSLGQAGAVVSAATLKAKLAGHLVERKEVRSGPLEDIDLKEIEAMRAKIRAEMDAESAAEDLVGEMPTPVVKQHGNRPTAKTLH